MTYYERFLAYADAEYAILYARLRHLLTDEEYREARYWAYVIHGFKPPRPLHRT